jgi:dUTPase
MSLHDTFARQADFQRHIDAHPESMEDPEEKIQYIKDMVYALESELHEMMQEIGWKPWATSRHINYEAAKSELVDTFQFFMNLCFALGMSADELLDRHAEKLKINYSRAGGGYDGVSTKCAWCGRALDDKYVSCETDTPWRGTLYCSEKAKSGDGFFTAEDLERKK